MTRPRSKQGPTSVWPRNNLPGSEKRGKYTAALRAAAEHAVEISEAQRQLLRDIAWYLLAYN